MEQKGGIFYISKELLFNYSISWIDFCSKSSYDEIRQEKDLQLLIFINWNNDFFEVTCWSLLLTQPERMLGSAKFLSHKLSLEVMKQLFVEAISSPKGNLYVRNIKPLKSSFACNIKELRPMRRHSYGCFEGLLPGYPKWSLDEESKKIICTIFISSNTLTFVFSKDDFTPKYKSDHHDGGWLVYTQKQHLIGIKKFPCIFELQSYLIGLLDKIEFKCDYSISDVYNIRYPFFYTTSLVKVCSIYEFFSILNVKDVGTIYETVEGGADQIEKDWIPLGRGGGLADAWDAVGWKYPPDYSRGCERNVDYSISLKYIKYKNSQYKELKNE